MEKILELQRVIAPELAMLVEDRYNILRHIIYGQPVGRRALAVAVQSSERVVRAHTDFLKEAGLVAFTPLGMSITAEGIAVFSALGGYMKALSGLAELEEQLACRLGLKQVVVISGDSETSIVARRELGRAAAGVLAQQLGDRMTVAVSGGSTMALVAEAVSFQAPTTTVVPSRGGLGEQVEYQANTIAAVMAGRLGGKYRLLHIPDGVGEAALAAILDRDAGMRAVVQMIRQADVLISGIGEATAMASRRGFDATTIRHLVESGAVGEIMGHYCTVKGEVVYVASGVGLHLDDLAGIGQTIAVAGGRKKALAIVAVTAAGGQDVLVTDEAAARAIQEIIN